MAAVTAVLASACSSAGGLAIPGAPDAQADGGSATVIASSLYALEVGEQAQADRLAEIGAVVESLRAESTSGWQARQSDRNGWAAEISGGRFTRPGDPVSVTGEFLDQFGALFGPASGFTFTTDGYDDRGYATVRIGQAVGDVPVDGSLLIASVRDRGAEAEVQSVWGEAVDTSGVDAQPATTGEQAVEAVSTALGVAAVPRPVLLVAAVGGQVRLVWAVTVEEGPDRGAGAVLADAIDYPALVFVDAQTGAILGSRRSATNPTGRFAETPASSAVTAEAVPAMLPATDTPTPPPAIDYGNYDFDIPPGGRPIIIRTDYLGLFPIEVNAEQLPDGSIVMVDLTGPQANRTTGKGAIVVLDGTGLALGRQLASAVGLATLVRYPNVESIPVDALYAMWGVRQTLDYLYEDLGMLSFDGNNSPVPIVINYTDGRPCRNNASFLTGPGVSFMNTGVPCADNEGRKLETLVDIDTIAHELGHGLIHSHTFSRDTIQQGAMDEGLGDYLGMVMRRVVLGEASPVSSGDLCRDFEGVTPWCNEWADGRGGRSLSTGATFEQYLFTLEDPVSDTVVDFYSDSGHTNSMVWTNALWQARTAVASVDGGDVSTSERAKVFDRAVLRAATTITPGSDFLQGAEAILRTAAEEGMTTAELDLIRDRFRAAKLCQGCSPSPADIVEIQPVSVSTSIKHFPVALDGEIAFLLAEPASDPVIGVATPGVPGLRQVGQTGVFTVGIAGSGSTVVQTFEQFNSFGQFEGSSLAATDLTTGTVSVIARDIDVFVNPDVSDEGIVWAESDGNVVFQATGSTSVQSRAFDSRPAKVATSGDRVAVLTASGGLWVWTLSSDTVRRLDGFDPYPLEGFRSSSFVLSIGALAMHGDRVAIVGSSLARGPVVVYDLAAATKTTLSESGVPLGLAISDDFVVWTEVTGAQESPIVGEGPGARPLPDTQLRGYSFVDGLFYRMVDLRGQQAFPSLNESLLAWQETANGNSDIYAVPLPTR